MPKIDLQTGLAIHYTDLNRNGNPVVLLLHGLGASSDSWQLQYPELVHAGFRVLAPDLRGFGKSSYPGGLNNPQVMANDMVAFMEKLSIGTCHVIGLSMGGTVALQLAVDRPLLVKTLILTNTFAKLRPRNYSSWIFYATRLLLVHFFGMNKQADFVARRLFPNPNQGQLRVVFKSQVKKANSQGYRSVMRSYARYDLSEKIKSLQVPILIITGERDLIVPPEVQLEMATKIPGAKHVIISDASHAVSVEKPDEFNQNILKFINENSR